MADVEITLEEIERAWQAQDPAVVDLIVQLSTDHDRLPDPPPREGALTFQTFLQEQRIPSFRRKPLQEQHQWRVQTLQALEAPDAEVPLQERLKLHRVLWALWEDGGLFARGCLLKAIARCELKYGPWRAIKRIFKEAEASGDTEVLGTVAARLDRAHSSRRHGLSQATLAYMVRRAWRYLRRLGQQLPVAYPETAVQFMAAYTDDASFQSTWVLNHILYHNSRRYGGTDFRFYSNNPKDWLRHRAYPETWKRSPRPLFTLLERAQTDHVRKFAVVALQSDFRAELRDVEPGWVARLVSVNSEAVDGFVIWILDNVPAFEQAAFRELNLHEPVLRLFDSKNNDARKYAAKYARTYARDLPLQELVRLCNNDTEEVYKLALDLLQSRHPRNDVGLQAWGEVLETDHGHQVAAEVLKKQFGAADLTPDWFTDRLLSPNDYARRFAVKHLPHFHPAKKLGVSFFCDLIERADFDEECEADEVCDFALDYLKEFDVNALDTEFLKRLFVNDDTEGEVFKWVEKGRFKTSTLPVDFFKMLAYHVDWGRSQWVADLQRSGRRWAKSLEYPSSRRRDVLGWLGDVRKFRPVDVGLDWLLELVQRSEQDYNEFAVDLLTRAFVPADFAPADEGAGDATVGASTEDQSQADLQQQTFLFTGKLATMTRNEAQDKVKGANGKVASSVNAKLDYLVIGDEGSPLYGAGKKGSKQVKAESLVEEGASIKIISETAFLQMLSGQQVEHSADASLAGCERLWEMLTAEGAADAPLRQFSRHYFRRHHPDIALAETDRPVDPGAEIPQDFLTLERFEPLLLESRRTLRDFALQVCRWEFARWSPSASSLVKLCEAQYVEVRKFLAETLLAEESPETARWRLDPTALEPATVFRLCESRQSATRSLGMQLIDRHRHLRQPEELFRLTESPDRNVRAFVIRTLWSLYRNREITLGWKPYLPPFAESLGEKQKAARLKRHQELGIGAPQRPAQLPAEVPMLRGFMRRILFEIPPARPEKAAKQAAQVGVKLKPLPARKAKLSLVEVMRDLATEDRDFAEVVRPLFSEFMSSRGDSEQAACLVALTRIDSTFPDLAVPGHRLKFLTEPDPTQSNGSPPRIANKS